MGLVNRHQARARQAERRRVMEQLAAQEPTGDRLWGKCELCGKVHRQPDIRYRCSCGWSRCAQRVSEWGTTCPECGREMRMVDETTTIRGTDE